MYKEGTEYLKGHAVSMRGRGEVAMWISGIWMSGSAHRATWVKTME
jgi:ABC-type glycerol-3-phosphate transport system substrate-binding protein